VLSLSITTWKGNPKRNLEKGGRTTRGLGRLKPAQGMRGRTYSVPGENPPKDSENYVSIRKSVVLGKQKETKMGDDTEPTAGLD